MSSSRWDPWSDIVTLREAMNNLLEESFVSRPRPGGESGQPATSGLALDIRETPDAYVVQASVPGVSPHDVDITVLGDRLRIRGERRGGTEEQGENGRWILRERRFGAFERTINLPTAVKSDAAVAEFKDGVLTITLPKAEEAKPRSIPVRGGQQAIGESGGVSKSQSGESQAQTTQPGSQPSSPA
ncbi:MAG: Hsp20/alpha crystallin family protein [Thermomicrobiales bacterium]|nr:Hsp20/alpha crystallin family protein [Thermomicrobiales bacterium]